LDPTELSRVNPVEHVRSHPSLYLRGGIFDPVRGACRIAGDAMLLGSNDVTTDRIGEWLRVHSSTDWLLGADHPEVQALFESIVAFPEAGDNAFRGEILLTAFARDVYVSDASGGCVVKGELPPEAVRMAAGAARLVAFRSEPPGACGDL